MAKGASSSPERDLERLRRFRNSAERDRSVRDAAGAIGRELKAQARRVGGLGGMWAALCPAELLPHTTLVSLSRGVLTVRCDDASAKYQVHQWLKEGGETALIRRVPAGVTKVRLVI